MKITIQNHSRIVQRASNPLMLPDICQKGQIIHSSIDAIDHWPNAAAHIAKVSPANNDKERCHCLGLRR